jgi:hypothetical protein
MISCPYHVGIGVRLVLPQALLIWLVFGNYNQYQPIYTNRNECGLIDQKQTRMDRCQKGHPIILDELISKWLS